MDLNTDPSAVMDHIKQWALQQESVRAALLTGSRANPTASVDRLSDYDVILIVTDIQPFFETRSWVNDFGEVLVAYWDPLYRDPVGGLDQFGNVIQYTGGLKIDFTLCPLESFHRMSDPLNDELDAGYRVLVDKDDLTTSMPAPTYTGYLPDLPAQDQFMQFVEEFFSDAPYVAKCLWRDELLPAKWCLDHDMKHNYLRPLLAWRTRMNSAGAVRLGALGKGIKKALTPSEWEQLEKTYAGADIEENWQALFRTLQFFRQIALEVAHGLGLVYPLELDENVTNYVHFIKGLNPSASPR